MGNTLPIVDRLRFKTGKYDPLNTTRSGTFYFAMRDVDGLPVVSETHDFYPRLDEYTVSLHRATIPNSTSQTAQSTELRTTFIGNKVLNADGTYRPLRGQQEMALRQLDGRVEVVVELVYAGTHYVTILGPEGANGERLVPWAVEVTGLCDDLEATDENGQCICQAGATREAADKDCAVCELGYVKITAGNNLCQECIELNAATIGTHLEGGRDANRRMTRSARVEDHDSLADCGCAPGYFLQYLDLSPKAVTARCPSSSNVDQWLQHANLSRFASFCCGDALCSGRADWACVEQACREEYLKELLPLEEDPYAPAKCVLCDHVGQHDLECNESHVTLQSVHVKPGYWRTNELSSEMHVCRPSAACTGSNRSAGQLIDSLCREGHWGPLCASCTEGHFAGSNGLCKPCQDYAAEYWDYMVFAACLIGIALTAFCVISTIGAFCVRYIDACTSRVCGIVLGSRIMRTTKTIQVHLSVLLTLFRGWRVFSSFKDLMSMVQLQLGILPAFAVIYPPAFVR